MNTDISKEIEILWHYEDINEIEVKIEAIERINKLATEEDLPQLVDALKSQKSNFWIRELLSQPISEIGKAKYLDELFDAMLKNYDDGHDNDGLAFFLSEIASIEPIGCRAKLIDLALIPNYRHLGYVHWLLEFCEK
jgi:hypothetical protein